MQTPRSHRTSGRWDSTLTPMIDVVFLLLIFFVCTASFRRPEERLPADLASVGTLPSESPLELPDTDLGEVIVRVLHDERQQVQWEINGQSHHQADQVRGMLLALAKVQAALPVILDVQGNVPLHFAIDTYDWCRQAGFAQIQFAASLDAL